MSDAATWMGGWLIVIIGLVSLTQTGWGRTIVYYFLWLAVLLLVVTHSNTITTMVAQTGLVSLSDPSSGAK